MELTTKYGAARMSMELQMNELRAEVKYNVLGSEDPVKAMEKLITDHLMDDDEAHYQFDFDDFDYACDAMDNDYAFIDYPSNGLIILKGTAIMTYQEDEEGCEMYNETYDFPDLTPSDYDKLLKILGLDEKGE